MPRTECCSVGGHFETIRKELKQLERHIRDSEDISELYRIRLMLAFLRLQIESRVLRPS